MPKLSFPESPHKLAPKVSVADFSKNFDSSNVSGSVTITQDTTSEASQILTWSLKGLDPACRSGSDKPCSIEIHADESCDDTAKIQHDDNPLVSAQYHATIDGASEKASGIQVATAVSFKELLGNVLLVYNSFGYKLACALIPLGPSLNSSNSNSNSSNSNSTSSSTTTTSSSISSNSSSSSSDGNLLSGAVHNVRVALIPLALCALQLISF
jgi:hypothetical protein